MCIFELNIREEVAMLRGGSFCLDLVKTLSSSHFILPLFELLREKKKGTLLKKLPASHV